MKKTAIKKIKKLLTELRAELAGKISNPREILARKDDLGVDMDGDDVDAIQGEALVEINAQLSLRDRAKLVSIDGALARIKDGSFGACEECGEDILLARLLATPMVKTCIDCAETIERLAKQEASR